MNFLHPHILQLIAVSRYSAPPDAGVKARKIADGTEYIEILTAGEVIYDGQRYQRGTIFWHYAGEFTVNRYTVGRPYSCYLFRFTVRPPERFLMPRISSWSQPDLLEDICGEILRCFHDDSYSNDILAPYAYAALCWHAYTPRDRQLPLHKNVARAVNFIERHLGEPLSVSRIAAAAGVSESHLYLLFRTCLNNTPHRYILKQRLQRAKHLLVSSSESIKGICFICGFENTETFYRAFRRQYGQTPGAYREYHMP
jgi:AraC-like DNA-binding protein